VTQRDDLHATFQREDGDKDLVNGKQIVLEAVLLSLGLGRERLETAITSNNNNYNNKQICIAP